MYTHPLLLGGALILLDLTLWQCLGPPKRTLRTVLRVLVFALFCWVMVTAGISPLQPPPWPDDAVLNLMATVMGIGWWLFAARTVTVILGHGLTARVGQSARLLHDVMGAVIFLVAIVGAAAYVLQLPVKGLLATSGAMAIILGLAVQSTLSDVFSGIVINTTKPYQIDDWVSIDGIEGKVLDIDWRSTHLQTEAGSVAVVPNSLAAKAKILNHSRPAALHGVSVTLAVPSAAAPRQVLEALEKALQGTQALLPGQAAKVSIKSSQLGFNEYELRGFVASRSARSGVRNLMFDLAHRHLEAAGVTWGATVQAWSRQRQLLEEARVMRALSVEERDRLADAMTAVDFQANQVLLAFDEIADGLLIIAAGVVSVAVHDGERVVEAVRMGPGEVMGEEGILTDGRSRGQFRSLTSGRLYRIEKALLGAQLQHSSDLLMALDKLQHQREGIRDAVVLKKPQPIKKTGFLRWLQDK
ncbi:mechanosensitive ion channel family protein [Pseudomonas sp. P115]|uniref:mechanosensitive ion channel family protein n=1 Tax=Pseudomonas pisciculturae TaxID=2730413 RepID=UPI00189243A0|nr:mechanosensitive ion channel family protein [Pseudomonas pisciculturae]MBF6030475.1 mechanosensitive ion channel family protein [Pseudomonas pisciculturae]